MVENFILSKIFCPKFSCIKFSMPDIPKFSNHHKLVCIKFYVKNFPVSRQDLDGEKSRNAFQNKILFTKLNGNDVSSIMKKIQTHPDIWGESTLPQGQDPDGEKSRNAFQSKILFTKPVGVVSNNILKIFSDPTGPLGGVHPAPGVGSWQGEVQECILEQNSFYKTCWRCFK